MTKILIIDDSKTFLFATKALLEDLEPSFEVFTAENGIEGIKLANSNKPDIILLDIVMPTLDGYEVCQQLRADKNTKLIPIIYLTGIKTNSEDMIKGLELGGDAYLTKPIEEGVLLAYMNSMLRIKRVEDDLQMEKDLLEQRVQERTIEFQKSERRYRNLIESAPTGIISIDTDGKITSVNPKMLEILRSPSSVLTKRINMFNFKPLQEIGVSDAFIGVIESGESFQAEVEYTSKWNKTSFISYSIVALHGSNEKIIGAQAIVEDITESKKAEEEIQGKNLFLESLIMQSPLPTFIYDAEGICTNVNKAFVDFYGIPEGMPICGVNVLTFPPNIEQGTVPYMKQALKGEVILTPDMEFNSPGDGKLTITRSTLFPIKDVSGELTHVVVMQQDITELKHSEKKLMQKMDVLDRMNQLMVGRELKMVDLKKEVNELLKKAGQSKKYHPTEPDKQ